MGIDCHRRNFALRDKGFRLNGYREQKKRLKAEGVAVLAGRVDMRKYRWQPDLDELLWKPSPAWDDR